MIDLTTTYLGLKLRTPLVASASPLSQSLDDIRRLEDAGASAVVLYSLFEEQLHQALTQQIRKADIVLISDYDKGVCTPRVLTAVGCTLRYSGARILGAPSLNRSMSQGRPTSSNIQTMRTERALGA